MTLWSELASTARKPGTITTSAAPTLTGTRGANVACKMGHNEKTCWVSQPTVLRRDPPEMEPESPNAASKNPTEQETVVEESDHVTTTKRDNEGTVLAKRQKTGDQVTVPTLSDQNAHKKNSALTFKKRRP